MFSNPISNYSVFLHAVSSIIVEFFRNLQVLAQIPLVTPLFNGSLSTLTFIGILCILPNIISKIPYHVCSMVTML